ncbi:MAG: roadblock/LC7 domain-containing protein [Promethearchaeota archaeon]
MKDFEIENLNKELSILDSVSGIRGTAIVYRNGLLRTSRLPRDIDDRKFGAMVATIYGALNTAVSTLEKEAIQNLLVQYKDYQVIALDIDEKFMMVALLDFNINFGLVLIELEEVINRIKTII